jgi:hypothetical protein
MNRLEIMEQFEAIRTQIHTTVPAYHTRLPNPFSKWHKPYVPKASVQHVNSKSTEDAFPTWARFDFLIDLTRFIKLGY